MVFGTYYTIIVFIIYISKITADLYDDIGSEYGYVVSKNRPVLVKLLSSAERE